MKLTKNIAKIKVYLIEQKLSIKYYKKSEQKLKKITSIKKSTNKILRKYHIVIFQTKNFILFEEKIKII